MLDGRNEDADANDMEERSEMFEKIETLLSFYSIDTSKTAVNEAIQTMLDTVVLFKI